MSNMYMDDMQMHHMGCMHPLAQMPMMNEGLVRTINECEATCEHMTTHIKRHYGVQTRACQLMLLRDCADICGLTAKFVARDSMYARECARLCACICEGCARECMRFADAGSQRCAQICMACARDCMAFASMG